MSSERSRRSIKQSIAAAATFKNDEGHCVVPFVRDGKLGLINTERSQVRGYDVVHQKLWAPGFVVPDANSGKRQRRANTDAGGFAERFFRRPPFGEPRCWIPDFI